MLPSLPATKETISNLSSSKSFLPPYINVTRLTHLTVKISNSQSDIVDINKCLASKEVGGVGALDGNHHVNRGSVPGPVHSHDVLVLARVIDHIAVFERNREASDADEDRTAARWLWNPRPGAKIVGNVGTYQ